MARSRLLHGLAALALWAIWHSASLPADDDNLADRFRTLVGETVSTAQKIGASASDLSSISEEVAASSGEVEPAAQDA